MLRYTEVIDRCAEVHRGVCRGVERCMNGYVDMQSCIDRCAVVHGGVQGVHEGVQRYAGVSGGVNWLPLPTIDLVGDNREIEAYFEVLYPFWVVDSLRTLKVHHYLSLVTIGCPSTPCCVLLHTSTYLCITPSMNFIG